MKKSEHRLGNSWTFSIVYFCLFITGLMFPLVYFEELINSGGIVFETFTVLIFGIGGIGIGLILMELLGKVESRIKIIEEDEMLSCNNK